MNAHTQLVRNTVIAVAAAAAMVGVTTAAAPTAQAIPGTPAPTWNWSGSQPERDLAELLLPATQIAVITGADTDMKTAGPLKTLDDQSAKVRSERRCLSAWAPAQQQSYAGSGWSAAALDAVADDGADAGGVHHSVTQAVVSFPSPKSAADYLTSAAHDWAACANRTITYTSPRGSTDWRLSTPAMSRDKTLMAIGQAAVGAPSSRCERAVGTAGSVVIDVLVCGANPANQAIAVVRGIAENIGQPA